MNRVNKITYGFAAFLSVFILIFSYLFAGGGVVVHAATSTKEAYEQRNVLDDLQDSTISGEPFSLERFNFDSKKETQVLSFVEYCYSFLPVNMQDFGLYLYVYNPKGINYDKTSSRNYVSLRAGGNKSNHYVKYRLEFLNESIADNCKGLFLKYKVSLNSFETDEIISALADEERIYDISEIELLKVGDLNATAYAVSKKYTYTGYAKGYGLPGRSESTLNCDEYGIDTLSLDVHSTYYRPKGTHKDGYTRDTLHSVYFSVPNSVIEESGEMTAVHAKWLNAYTAPMLVTGNRTIYNSLYQHLGEYIDGGSQESHKSVLNYSILTAGLGGDGILSGDLQTGASGSLLPSLYAYNPYMSCYDGDNMYNDFYTNLVSRLHYLFYADNGDADNYVLPAEKIVGDKAKGVEGWLEYYTNGCLSGDFGNVFDNGDLVTGGGFRGQLVLYKYLRDLFDKVDVNFTDVNIESTKEYKLQDNTVSTNLWDRLFGKQLKYENSYTMSVIQKVTRNDIYRVSDRELFCDTYFVAESDYDDFVAFVKAAEDKDEPETVYLFRYYQTEYVSVEAGEYERTTEWTLAGNFGAYKKLDTNAYFAQMWIQLDFDIIDVTFTNSEGSTVIGVVMSPMDVAASGDPPVNTTPEPDPKGGCGVDMTWLSFVLILLLVVFVIWLIGLLRSAFGSNRAKVVVNVSDIENDKRRKER